ncbi:MAG: EAL domain-containing protein, partial [Myxococcota bacterium]
AQLARWDELGYEPVRVHVNVSPRQFESGVLPDTVRAALQRHRLAPCRLELEITESTLMRNTRSSNDVLSSLKDLGVGLSIDDFGTGYSSLAYLHRFRVDTLKIDRSFVDQLGRSDDADAVTSAVLSLAQQLRLNVVAEGIETEAQLQFMKQRGCHFGQGFYYARPADADTVRHTLRGYKAELRHVAS